MALVFAQGFTKAYSRSKSSNSSQRTAYYQISNPDQPKILSKLKLKKGDKIVSINGKKRPRQKEFHQNLYSLLKGSQTFNVKIQRGGKLFLLSYTKTGKNNNKLAVSQKSLSTRRLAGAKTSSKSNKSNLAKNKSNSKSKLAKNKSNSKSSLAKNKSNSKSNLAKNKSRSKSSLAKNKSNSKSNLAKNKSNSKKNQARSKKNKSSLAKNTTVRKKNQLASNSKRKGADATAKNKLGSKSKTKQRNRGLAEVKTKQTEKQPVTDSTQNKLSSAKKQPTLAKNTATSTKNQPALNKNKAGSAKRADTTTKKNLVPDKYKPFMQRAFVSSLDSFIYKNHDFDSVKLYSLPVGKKILISRKIFRPDHNFGSFYKIFLFGSQKIVGYISEAEVIPEYLQAEDKSYKLNPFYKKAKIYKDKNKVLNLEEIENITNPQQKQKRRQRSAFYTALKKQIGLSSTWIHLAEPYFDRTNYFNFPKQTLIGLDFSLQQLYSLHWLSAHVKSSLEFQTFYLDLLAGYRLFNRAFLSVFVLGGASMSWDISYNRQENPQNSNIRNDSPQIIFELGPSGALLASIPLTKKIHLHVSPQIFYQLYRRSPNSSPLSFNVSAGLRYDF